MSASWAKVSIVAVVLCSRSVIAACDPDWQSTGLIAGVDGWVYGVVLWDPDGDGPLEERPVVCGDFELGSSGSAEDIAIWNGAVWVPLGDDFNVDSVRAMAVYHGQLYAAGEIRTWQGVFGYVKRLVNGIWETVLDTAGIVNALMVYQGELLLGGGSMYIDGYYCYGVARWDGNEWHSTGRGPQGIVYAMTEFDGRLIIGGQFRIIMTPPGAPPAGPSITVDCLAAWDGTDWFALPAFPAETVRGLCVHNGELIAGGYDANAPPSFNLNIASWDGSSEQMQVLGDGLTGPVRSMLSHDGLLLAGGSFGERPGRPKGPLAIWDGQAWSQIASDEANILAMFGWGMDVLAGGAFESIGEAPARNVARWDGGSFHTLGSSGLNGWAVCAATRFNGATVVGGLLDFAGPDRTSNLALFSGGSWMDVADGPDQVVYALEPWNNRLYCGGAFTQAGGQTARRIAQWDGNTWSAVGGGVSLTPGFDQSLVRALAMHDGRLIVGGRFNRAGSLPVSNVAAWDGLTWQPLGLGVAGHEVFALAHHGGELYAAGHLGDDPNALTGPVQHWDGFTWTRVGDNLTGYGFALASFRDELYAAGKLTVSGQAPALLVRWTGSVWEAVPGAPLGGTYAIRALRVFDDRLYAGGSFYRPQSRSTGYLGWWDGLNWQYTDADANDTVFALVVGDGELLVGGAFDRVGDTISPRVALWGCESPDTCPGDMNCDQLVDFLDIDRFVEALAADGTWPYACERLAADCDGDGAVTFLDVDPFVARLGASCPE